MNGFTRPWLFALSLLPLGLFTVSAQSQVRAQASEDPSKDIERELHTLLSGHAADGFSGTVLVAVGGRIVFERGYGLADRALKIPITPDTRFDFASIAKTFTGAAILALEAEGRLSTADPLVRHIGRLPEAKSAATVHQLASHRAGLAASLPNTDGLDRSGWVAVMRDAPIDSPPGEAYRYSNAGFGLLAAVVEIAAEEPFHDYVRRELIEPAGLDETVFLSDLDPTDESTDRSTDKSVAKAYSDATANAAPPPYRYGWGVIGAAGLISTVGDIYRWYQVMWEGTILPAAQREKQFDASETEAYGWHVDTRDGRLRVHKGGGLPAMQAQIMAYPDDDVVIVWAHNSTEKSWRRPLNEGITAVVMGEK